jgi:hypothetical protein
MANKIYSKRGNHSYKEKRMISAIEDAVSKLQANDPNYQTPTATNYEELEKIWTELCTEEVEFTEKKNNINQVEEEVIEMDEVGQDNSFTDPFNRAEPIVRDYVKGVDFPGEKAIKSPNLNYAEPQTRMQQMQLPDDETEAPAKAEKKEFKGARDEFFGGDEPSKKSQQVPPKEPKFNDEPVKQSVGDKEGTKKLAKQLVNLFALAVSGGLNYLGTDGIREDQLEKLSAEGLIDLSFYIQLDAETETDVAKFFASQRERIGEAVKVSEAEKDEIVQLLIPILSKRGVTASPEALLGMKMVEVFLPKIIVTFTLKKQNNVIIEQLKQIKLQQAEILKSSNQERQSTPTPKESPKEEVKAEEPKEVIDDSIEIIEEN